MNSNESLGKLMLMIVNNEFLISSNIKGKVIF